MLSTVKKIKTQVGLSVPPSVGLKEALQWMLLARMSVLFLVLFTILARNIFAKTLTGEWVLGHGLVLISSSFLVTLFQACILEKITVNWNWVGFHIVFDSVLIGLWIFFGQSTEAVFPLFYLIQILIVSLTFYQKGAWFSSLASVFSLGVLTLMKISPDSGTFFLWGIYIIK